MAEQRPDCLHTCMLEKALEYITQYWWFSETATARIQLCCGIMHPCVMAGFGQIDDYWEPSKKSLWGVGTCAFQLLMFGLWSRYPCRFCIAEDSKMLDRLLGWESWKLWHVDMHTLGLHTCSIGYLYIILLYYSTFPSPTLQAMQLRIWQGPYSSWQLSTTQHCNLVIVFVPRSTFHVINECFRRKVAFVKMCRCNSKCTFPFIQYP